LISDCYFVLCGILPADCSREERRWIEKQNKAARQKLKKEEISRMRQLVGRFLILTRNKYCIDLHTVIVLIFV